MKITTKMLSRYFLKLLPLGKKHYVGGIVFHKHKFLVHHRVLVDFNISVMIV